METIDLPGILYTERDCLSIEGWKGDAECRVVLDGTQNAVIQGVQIDRFGAGRPSLRSDDGPHGLRFQVEGYSPAG